MSSHTDREADLFIFIGMKKFELNFPKKYIEKTDEIRNQVIRDMFLISQKKDDTNSQEEEDSCS